MQADYPARFSREMGCTPEELRTWLPGASRGARIAWEASGATVWLEGREGLEGPHGLQLHWTALPPRRIALITLPRLQVSFDFGGLDAAARHHFMRYFDLYTQRGGG
jgi:hypothetical protein